MTDINDNDDSTQLEAIDNLDIATLRKYAKLAGIAAKKDWAKEDFVAAIKAQQEVASTSLVFDDNKGPRAGFARILIHRDPTPGHKNSPVHVAVNGHIFSIPRGVQVDVPYPIVEVLANAKTIDTNEQASPDQRNPGGVFKEVERPSYPFQVIAVTPGKYVNQSDTRTATYNLRKEFHTKHGTWPTHAELAEYRKAKINERI